MRAVVETNPDTSLCAGVEQAFAAGILADGVNERIVGQTGDDFAPGFAEVGGFENVGMKIIELVRVDRDVSGADVEWRRIDDADGGPLGNFLGRDVGPVFSTVAGHVKQAVIGAGPEKAFLPG